MNYGVSVSSCLMTPLIWVMVLFVIYYMPIVCLVHPLEEVLKKILHLSLDFSVCKPNTSFGQLFRGHVMFISTSGVVILRGCLVALRKFFEKASFYI